MTNYTNPTLANDFFRVAGSYFTDNDRLRTVMAKISRHQIDLSVYYKEHGELTGVKGFNDLNRRTLELILSGMDLVVVRDELEQSLSDPQKMAALLRKSYTDKSPIHNSDLPATGGRLPVYDRADTDSPSFENAVRTREQD